MRIAKDAYNYTKLTELLLNGDMQKILKLDAVRVLRAVKAKSAIQTGRTLTQSLDNQAAQCGHMNKCIVGLCMHKPIKIFTLEIFPGNAYIYTRNSESM